MLNLQLELSAKSDEKLNTYMFSNHDKNKFILLLQDLLILMNIWMIGKNSMKHNYLKIKTFAVT